MHRTMLTTLALATAALIAAATPVPATAADAPVAAPEKAAPDKAALEKQFADLLTNAVLVGRYSLTGKDGPAKDDRYTILKAVKGDGENWVITAKVEYKGFGVPVDFTVPVRWAGDTPMIQMTNQQVPGMGAFTVRVMFYGNQYAGTWDAGDHGGLMWGRIERAAANPAGAATKAAGGGTAAPKSDGTGVGEKKSAEERKP